MWKILAGTKKPKRSKSEVMTMKKKHAPLRLKLLAIVIVAAPWIILPLSYEAFLFLLGLKVGVVGAMCAVAYFLRE